MNGAYVNVPNIGMADWETAYWGCNFDRLRKIKAKYDPHNVFQYEQSIPPPSVEMTPARVFDSQRQCGESVQRAEASIATYPSGACVMTTTDLQLCNEDSQAPATRPVLV